MCASFLGTVRQPRVLVKGKPVSLAEAEEILGQAFKHDRSFQKELQKISFISDEAARLSALVAFYSARAEALGKGRKEPSTRTRQDGVFARIVEKNGDDLLIAQLLVYFRRYRPDVAARAYQESLHASELNLRAGVARRYLALFREDYVGRFGREIHSDGDAQLALFNFTDTLARKRS